MEKKTLLFKDYKLYLTAVSYTHLFELFYRLFVPGLWKGPHLPAAGSDPVAGIQYPHAVFAQWVVRVITVCQQLAIVSVESIATLIFRIAG